MSLEKKSNKLSLINGFVLRLGTMSVCFKFSFQSLIIITTVLIELRFYIFVYI